MQQMILEDMEELEVQRESIFSVEENEKFLLDIFEMGRDATLKFTNPIRDYSHLLANRALHKLIELKQAISHQRCYQGTLNSKKDYWGISRKRKMCLWPISGGRKGWECSTAEAASLLEEGGPKRC